MKNLIKIIILTIISTQINASDLANYQKQQAHNQNQKAPMSQQSTLILLRQPLLRGPQSSNIRYQSTNPGKQ